MNSEEKIMEELQDKVISQINSEIEKATDDYLRGLKGEGTTDELTGLLNICHTK